MDRKIRTNVDLKYFGERLKIEKELNIPNDNKRYVYQVSCKGNIYILKGFKIYLEHLSPGNKTSEHLFMTSLIQISEVFQEYYFAVATSSFNPHITTPLFMDFAIDLAKYGMSHSYMYIEIIFEYEGTSLTSIQPTTLELTYNLMRQSANALFLLHNLNMAHFDIKPANMVYDRKKDLLKIIDMGNVFARANQKKIEGTTVVLEEKIRSATLGFAPPEIVSMAKDLIVNPKLKLTSTAIDVYSWAMSFLALLADRKDSELTKNYEKYKMGTEKDYEGFMKIIEADFNSIQTANSKEQDLKRCIKSLLYKALRYRPEERPKMEDLIDEMRKFERRKKNKIKYSQTEIEHDERIMSLYMLNNKLNNISNNKKKKIEWEEMKEEDKVVEVENVKEKHKIDQQVKSKEENKTKIEKKRIIEKEDEEEGKMVELNFGHRLNKDYLIDYALKLFIKKQFYKYCYLYETRKEVERLKSFPLSCGCIWTMFGKKIEYDNDLTKNSYGVCNKGHPLTSIDLGIINDFISFKFTSLMISDYPKRKKELVNSFSELLKKENIEDIAWVLKYTKAVTVLCLRREYIGDKGVKIISEALKVNKTLTYLNIDDNDIGGEGVKSISEALKLNKTLKYLHIINNDIGIRGAKIISELLKVNETLTILAMDNNDIRVEGVEAISEALRINKTLSYLHINNNNIGVEGTKVISKALKVNKTLTYLDIGNNNIGIKGAEIICELLKVNTTLKELTISHNKVGSEGAKIISETLKVNNTLTKLDLSYNDIGDEAMMTINELLKINTTLEWLNLRENKMTTEGVRVIFEATAVNTTLRSLSL